MKRHLSGQRVKCRCESCRFMASVTRIQTKLSRYDKAVIERLLNKWAHESVDATYYRLKLAGKWAGDHLSERHFPPPTGKRRTQLPR